MAKRNPSALKAHRQNVKRREHNRELRSKLRTGLKAIRAALDGGKVDDAKALLAATASLVDRMAGKGIIHRNTAGRYKSRLTARLKATPRPPEPRLAAGRRPLEHAPHSSTTSHSSTWRGSPRDDLSARSASSTADSARRARASGRSCPAAARICPRIIGPAAPPSISVSTSRAAAAASPRFSMSMSANTPDDSSTGMTTSRTCAAVIVDSPAA